MKERMVKVGLRNYACSSNIRHFPNFLCNEGAEENIFSEEELSDRRLDKTAS
jgi:hypothetical protein